MRKYKATGNLKKSSNRTQQKKVEKHGKSNEAPSVAREDHAGFSY